MGTRGWIKLHRKSTENELYFDGPFDRWHAWQDLLLMATATTETVTLKGEQIKLVPGQIVTSLQILADRWSWSKKKVRTFLDLLTKKGMISAKGTVKGTEQGTANGTTKGTAKGTVLTVENWGKYQGRGHSKGHSEGHSEGHNEGHNKGHLSRSIKEDKEVKSRSNNNIYINKSAEKSEKATTTTTTSPEIPSLTMINTWLAANGKTANAQKFLAYNNARGWKIGGKAAAWQDLLALWVAQEEEHRPDPGGMKSAADPEPELDYDFDEIERLLVNK